MKKFLLKVVLFFAAVIGVDAAYGVVCRYLNTHAKEGSTTYTNDYIANRTSEEIIMMGSSRMRHHYVPKIFSDSTGFTCYNAGVDGNGIIVAYGYLQLIIERYIPEIVIYDITGYDMYVDKIAGNIKYLNTLREYFDRPYIKEIFKDISYPESIKMYSQLYRYNSRLPRYVGDNILVTQNLQNGYAPLFKTLDYEPEKDTYEPSEVDIVKTDYVNKFIDICIEKRIKLVFSVSPVYNATDESEYYDPIKELCQDRQIPFIDMYNCPGISHHKEYFQDNGHLNDKGAHAFTKMFIGRLKEVAEME